MTKMVAMTSGWLLGSAVSCVVLWSVFQLIKWLTLIHNRVATTFMRIKK